MQYKMMGERRGKGTWKRPCTSILLKQSRTDTLDTLDVTGVMSLQGSRNLTLLEGSPDTAYTEARTGAGGELHNPEAHRVYYIQLNS